MEAAKIGLSRLGVKQRLGVLREKNILRVNYPIVIHRFFPGFCPCPLKNLLVRGVNGYIEPPLCPPALRCGVTACIRPAV